jgi:hypothetical protein
MKKKDATQQGGGQHGWRWMSSMKRTTCFEVERALNRVAIHWRGRSGAKNSGANPYIFNLRGA